MKTTSIASVNCKLKSNPIIKIEMNEQYPTGPIENEHRHSFPVIHIDTKGKILNANKASFPLLREWNCLASNYLPEELIRQFSKLLNLDADFDMRIITKSIQYRLDVIGFKESGYIGIYGFHKESNTPANQTSDLRVA